MTSAALGAAAETRALGHLLAQGLKLVARNWRCAGGELDLVLREGDTLVIAEVRSRSRSDYGNAFDSVGARKRQRLLHAARLFLAAHPQYAAMPVRLDVVALDGKDGLEWMRGAFEDG